MNTIASNREWTADLREHAGRVSLAYILAFEYALHDYTRISDEEILERIERQLEERQQEYDAERFHLGLRDASERSR